MAGHTSEQCKSVKEVQGHIWSRYDPGDTLTIAKILRFFIFLQIFKFCPSVGKEASSSTLSHYKYRHYIIIYFLKL